MSDEGGSQRVWNECPESVTGHGRTDVQGRCPWCGRRIERVQPVQNLQGWRTELDRSYRQHYDPDFGSDVRDD
jgi:hypothetical protein